MKGIFYAKCRKKKCQTLFLISSIVIVYFLLQFFSLSKLGSVQTLKKSHDEQSEHVFDAVIEDRHNAAIELDFDLDQESNEALKDRPPRGVLPVNVDQYSSDSDGMFKCLGSKKRIPVTRVNDDFCDCPDSSDEPGTNACPDGRFYCEMQIPHQDAQFIESSKVNDGICDCCDGSDEWDNCTVPPNMQLHGKAGAVFHAPCFNHCGNIEKLLEDERRIRKQGQKLKERYLNAASNLTVPQRRKFGPGGVFYLLSKQCFDHKTSLYTYSICPFESVAQISGRRTVLGRQGVWLQQKREDYILKMGGGEDSLCFDGQPRQAQIRFLCGLEDRVIDVREDQVCR